MGHKLTNLLNADDFLFLFWPSAGTSWASPGATAPRSCALDSQAGQGGPCLITVLPAAPEFRIPSARMLVRRAPCIATRAPPLPKRCSSFPPATVGSCLGWRSVAGLMLKPTSFSAGPWSTGGQSRWRSRFDRNTPCGS